MGAMECSCRTNAPVWLGLDFWVGLDGSGLFKTVLSSLERGCSWTACICSDSQLVQCRGKPALLRSCLAAHIQDERYSPQECDFCPGSHEFWLFRAFSWQTLEQLCQAAARQVCSGRGQCVPFAALWLEGNVELTTN